MIDEALRQGNSRQRVLTRLKQQADSRGWATARQAHLILAIDRLLARLNEVASNDSWVVKGGYANQLRQPFGARFTEDVDLHIGADIERAPLVLADAFAVNLDDLLEYTAPSAPVALEGPPGGGLRYQVIALLVGSQLVNFEIDFSAADAIVGSLQIFSSDPLLPAVGYPTSQFPVYPVEQSVAEKLHALTLPRSQENTRARDLVDLVWFGERFSFWSDNLIDACRATFETRGTHEWPPQIPEPPTAWARAYARNRAELSLNASDLRAAESDLAVFFAPVFAEQRGLLWDTTPGAWRG